MDLIEVPCKYVFEGNRFAVKFLRERIIREKNIVEDAFARNQVTRFVNLGEVSQRINRVAKALQSVKIHDRSIMTNALVGRTVKYTSGY